MRVPSQVQQANAVPSQVQQGGGVKWVSTGRKVRIVKHGNPPCERTVYRNAATGEKRVRKVVVSGQGTHRVKRKVTYVKF
jgi:hypothetical protein